MHEEKPYRGIFGRISLRQQLLWFTCGLLLFVIAAYSLVSYIGVKKAALMVGRERLQSLTGQLSTLLQQSVQNMSGTTHTVAGTETIRRVLQTNGQSNDSVALNQLKSLSKDSGSVYTAVLDTNKKTVLSFGKEERIHAIDISREWAIFEHATDTVILGNLHAYKGAVYFPVMSSVMDRGKRRLGYLLRWRVAATNPRSLEQLMSLMGSGGALLLGNRDGSLWTNMIHQVDAPPVEDLRKASMISYQARSGGEVFAAVQPLSNTPWVVLFEFSKRKMTEAANRFLYWDIAIGLVLIIIGVTAALLMGLSITRPLDKLTKASSGIGEGDYSLLVNIDRRDEVGILGQAFNNMAKKIQHAQEELEKEVSERTEELLLANKELEAFSYSVSHDLRAPLRAIMGYAAILREDYEPRLDDEAKRLINIIITNTEMMGKLIDDLIAFSMMGKKKISAHPVDMRLLAESCLQEVLANNSDITYQTSIAALPPADGDSSLLRQVWLNLIDNAAKYSSKQTDPVIEIGFEQHKTETIYFVRDNGIGFDMNYGHKLFSVFQRLHSKAEFKGTGIGLALVKRIIDKHGGNVWANSVPGEQTVFYFSIPVSK